MLDKVKTIVTHHRQLTHAKGELFNIYEILNLKTKEVRTHSAFIAELLNPKGTHLMGNAFLKAFLSFLPMNVTNHLDQDSVTLIVEFHIGVINKKNKTGGRIDILLVDQSGASICIENKIDAGDGEEQIERYCNYNRTKNQVIYLSKFGEKPTVFSRGELFVDNDFHVISYQNQIISWLEICQTIASDQPIVRESIKQYKILIQKITNTLGDKQDKELKTVVLNNLEEASLIASKYNQVVNEIKNNLRNKVVEILNLKTNEYNIRTPKNIDSQYASIWFNNKICDSNQRWFGAESFGTSGLNNGVLFVGIFDKKGLSLSKNYNALSKNWIHHEIIKYENSEINLSDNSFLQKIITDEQLNNLAQAIAEQIISFINEHNHLINNDNE